MKISELTQIPTGIKRLAAKAVDREVELAKVKSGTLPESLRPQILKEMAVVYQSARENLALNPTKFSLSEIVGTMRTKKSGELRNLGSTHKSDQKIYTQMAEILEKFPSVENIEKRMVRAAKNQAN